MLERVDPDHPQAFEIELLNIGRAWLQDHLILVIMLKPVGVLTITAIGWAAARLNEGGAPWLWPQRAQRGCGVKCTRSHLHIVRLKDEAALRAPEIMESEDHVLKAMGRIAVRSHGPGPWRNARFRSMPQSFVSRYPDHLAGNHDIVSGSVDIVSELRHTVNTT